MKKIRLAIVDDHAIFREGVASVLSAEDDILIVGQGASADEAIQLAAMYTPDVILLDINMPGGGGLRATQVIVALHPTIKLVILTGSDDEDDVIHLLKAGAHAYILKGVMARELLDVIHLVHAGKGYVSPTLAADMLRGMSQASPAARQLPAEDDRLADLTERERQILNLIADGLSNFDIGQQLFLTEKTVKHYVTSILQKLQVQNRVQAALLVQKSRPAQR